MKKTLVLFLVLIMIFSVSCNAGQDLLGDGTICVGDPVVNYVKSIKEYDEYVNANAKPKDFVSYEMLSDIGAFDTFMHTERGETMDDYRYRLKTGNGKLINVEILHNFVDNSETDIVYLSSPPSKGFDKTDEFKKAAVSYNEILYMYLESGELTAIAVVIDKTRIMLRPDQDVRFSDYDFENDNLVTCLLSGNRDNVDIASRYLTE